MRYQSLKSSCYRLLIILLAFSCSLSGYAASFSKEISIQESRSALIAPKGKAYSWHFNGEILKKEKDQSLHIQESGTYTVNYTDESGNPASETVSVLVAEGKIIRIFTIGDSTVQDYNSGWYPRKGWGQVLPFFFDQGVSVINKAVGGTSSKSFYNNHWTPIKDQLQPGDFVLIQFGINDRSNDPERRAFGDEFKGYLRNFVNETRAKGGFPVLVSTVRRARWNSDGTMYDSYHEHPQLVRDVAAEMNVPLLDLDQISKALMESLGPEYSDNYFYNIYEPGEYPNYPNGNYDQVHFQEAGAIEMAKIVVDELKRYESDENISLLIPHIKPQYELKVSPNKPGVGLATRPTTYPAGVTVTLKAIPAAGHTFLRWKDAEGNVISSNKLYSLTMGTEDRTIIGYFDDEEIIRDCNGDIGGMAATDDCGVCSGGWTDLKACAASIQAETACNEGTVETAVDGFMGTGYAKTKNESGATLIWFMDGSVPEEYVLSIRYANGGSTPLQAQFVLNEEELGELSFSPTESPTDWNTVSQKMILNRGSNTLKLVALSEQGLPNIDQFSWSVDHVRAGTGVCPEPINTAVDVKELSKGIRVFPNPFQEQFRISSIGPVNYKIYSISGKLISSGTSEGERELGKELAPGFYQLIIITKKGSYSVKVIKK